MKPIRMENGIILYYGNRAGCVAEGRAIVDPMFQSAELELFLQKQKTIREVRWQNGTFDRLAGGGGEREKGQVLKDVRVWQLRPDVDVQMKFIDFSQLERRYGLPQAENYIQVYDGAADTNDLEELYDRFRYRPPAGYTGHGLSISDVLELYDETGSSFFYVDRYDFKEIDFSEQGQIQGQISGMQF